MSHSEVDDVLSSTYVLSREKTVEQRLDGYQEHLSTVVCLDIKADTSLSRRKYDGVRQLDS